MVRGIVTDVNIVCEVEPRASSEWQSPLGDTLDHPLNICHIGTNAILELEEVSW